MPASDCHFLNYLGDQKKYVVSLILSFLDENGGTSMLITNYFWSRRLLPIFEVSHHLLQTSNEASVTDNTRKLRKIRHLFRVFPAQDSSTLLERLNTTRLAARIRHYKRDPQNTDDDHDDDARATKENQIYQRNMTTEEMAWYEWTQSRSDFVLNVTHQNDNQTTCNSNSSSSANSNDGGTPKFDLLRYRNPPSSTSYNFKPADNFLQWIGRNPSQLPPKILPGATVLASYPRSGNTLLRSLLERITNIVTGSDTRPDRTLSKSLSLQHDLVGEGVTNHQTTPIIKTHFPERRGCMLFNGARIILLVRNPYDAIDSYWNMCCTNTHTESVAEEIYERYEEKFRSLAMHEMATWLDFLKFWLKEGNTTFKMNGNDDEGSGPPLLLVRFEDLVLRTESVMEDVMKFLTSEGSNMNGVLHPFWKWRIRRALGTVDHSRSKPIQNRNGGENNCAATPSNVNTSSLGCYKPRSYQDEPSNGRSQKKVSSIGKSLGKNRYTQADLDHMHQIAEDGALSHPLKQEKINLLQALGYDIEVESFPHNFNQEEVLTDRLDFMYPTECRNKSTVRINKGPELRPSSSPFGRAMTRWRKSQTDDDREPFPIKK